jgi:hypothetical protein
VAAHEPQIWQEVDALLPKRTGSAYDRAATLLLDLRDLAGVQGRLPEVQARLAELQARYPKSRALQDRLNKLP